jgi:hypothetical protein
MTIKFAGKLNAFSRGPRGFFVKLEIGADDDWEDLAKSPLGMTFGVVMVPIDPETGRVPEASPGADSPPRSPDAGQQPGEAGKPRVPWSQMPRSQRAGIRCSDLKFQLWLSKRFPNAEGDAAEVLRAACGVKSRADLNESPEAGDRFDRLDAQFMQDTGQLAEARG